MWLQIGHALAANEEQFDLVTFDFFDANPVGDARNQIIEAAIAAEADWVLMVDADTYYRGVKDDPLNDGAGFDILRMVKEANAAGAAVVGAPVTARWTDGRSPRTCWMADEVSTLKGFSRTMSLASEEQYKDKLVECMRIGGAFLAVNIGWLRANMPDPPWFTHEPVMIGPRSERVHSYGEDTGFCDRVRIARGTILVDGRIFPKHVMRPERK